MKKFKFLLALALVLVLARPAFALQCKDGNSLGSDECWVDVLVNNEGNGLSNGLSAQVSKGTIVVVSTGLSGAGSLLTSFDAYSVRRTTSSHDFGSVGVIQNTIASTDLAKNSRVLVKGRGSVRVQNAAGNNEIVSGDQLRILTSTGFQGAATELVTSETLTGATCVVGVAASNSTEVTSDHLITAYIDMLNC